MESIEKKINDVEYNEITALMYALNILIMKFNFDVSWKLRKLLAENFPEIKDLTVDKKSDIATICFSLSSIVEKEFEESELKGLER